MIRIIDGKRFNTQTAELVASYWNGHFTNDFDYVSQDLYLTKRGTYFLHGEGGARSPYATRYGNSYGFGAHIKPVDPAIARRFCERHGDPETTARLFAVQDG